jgi:hypothetical protein
MERGAVGSLADERVCIDFSTAAGAELGNGPDVLRGVHQLELCRSSRRRLDRLAPEPARRGHRRFDRFEPLRAVWMLGRVPARVVLERRGVMQIEHEKTPD